MLPAIRIAYLIGFRRIFLLGCDMTMDKSSHYHFEQNRHEGSISGNNKTYELLKQRFAKLRPLFEAAGLNVYNCNPDSKLEVFDHISYGDAVRSVTQDEFGVDCAHERTFGLYERGGLVKKVAERDKEANKLLEKAQTISQKEGPKACVPLAKKAAREFKLMIEARDSLDKLKPENQHEPGT